MAERVTIEAKHGPVEKANILLRVVAEVQSNGDGTWTALCHVPSRRIGPETADTRADALDALTRSTEVFF
jgi:hypothetical protein